VGCLPQLPLPIEFSSILVFEFLHLFLPIASPYLF
jgi:hypothetical protein